MSTFKFKVYHSPADERDNVPTDYEEEVQHKPILPFICHVVLAIYALFLLKGLVTLRADPTLTFIWIPPRVSTEKVKEGSWSTYCHNSPCTQHNYGTDETSPFVRLLHSSVS